MRPAEMWESVKIGNCGSPIETEAGWLVITHGVGPMRKYCIGAALLDLNDPSRVIGTPAPAAARARKETNAKATCPTSFTAAAPRPRAAG